MAEIGMPDVSSYQRPPPPNPLDQILKVRDTAGALGDIEVGKGIQQAIQPDGSIDRNTLAQVLKGSVAGSMKAPQALNALETLRQAGYAADQTGLQNFNTRMGLVARATAHIIDDPSKDGVMRGFGYLLNPNNKGAEVGLTVPQIADAQKHFYDPKGNLLPADQLVKVAKQFNTQALSSQEALRAHLPSMQPFDTGGAAGQVAAGTPMNPQGFSIPKQPGPTQGTVDTRQTLPDGQPNPNYGQPMIVGEQPSAPPNVTRFGPNGQPTPPVRQFTEGSQVVSREPPVDAATGKPIQTAQAAKANGPIPTALAPGAVAPLEASGVSYAKDLADSRNYRERMNPLAQAIPLLEKLGKTGVGPTQETVQHLKSAAQTLGLPGLNEKTITNYAEAKKYLAQNAATVAPPGTNIPSVLNAMEANPNMAQPQQAAVDLSKMLYGLGRLRQASVLAFQKTGLPAGQYNDWASTWSRDQDPRAYMADLLTPEQRKDLTAKIKKGSPQADKFANSYKTAKDLKLLGDVERP